jgi:hypothetical protein
MRAPSACSTSWSPTVRPEMASIATATADAEHAGDQHDAQLSAPVRTERHAVGDSLLQDRADRLQPLLLLEVLPLT